MGTLSAFRIAASCCLLVECGCVVKNAARIDSPDLQYTVLVKAILGGALSNDLARVRLRRNHWWSSSSDVYVGTAAWDFGKGVLSYPRIRWRDNTHLVIRFGDSSITGKNSSLTNRYCGNGEQHGVQVVCENIASPKTVRIAGEPSGVETCFLDQWTGAIFLDSHRGYSRKPGVWQTDDTIAQEKTMQLRHGRTYEVLVGTPAIPGMTFIKIGPTKSCSIDTDRLLPETF